MNPDQLVSVAVKNRAKYDQDFAAIKQTDDKIAALQAERQTEVETVAADVPTVNDSIDAAIAALASLKIPVAQEAVNVQPGFLKIS